MKNLYPRIFRNIFLLICFLTISVLSPLGLMGQQTAVYNSPGPDTYLVPAGVTQITIMTWGGGGAGVGRTSNGNGSGGVSGGFAYRVQTVTTGQTIHLSVGAGATGTTGNAGTRGGA